MTDISSRVQAELRRLSVPPAPQEKPGGIGSVRFVARCPVGATGVLENAKSVLKIVDEATLGYWPKSLEWRSKLPEWFISACAPERTKEESDRDIASWRSL